ncbi:S8 family serine peptidase [Methylobacterium durans]|uniref:S8 family serine peptidase n=1 Tax=Methylobacterium durans TaxID=2202825 RepID=UPI002AFED05E|nr:S8 family serine peptidase [Methylobacterium durans]MEA1831030.1 S8 family serine peptidase [Methylobacterium durans]
MREPFDTLPSRAGPLGRLAAIVLLLAGGLAPAAAQTRPGAVLDRGMPSRGGYGGGPAIGLPGLIGIVPRLIPPPRAVVEEEDEPPRRAPRVRAVPESRPPPPRRQAAPEPARRTPKRAPKLATKPPGPPPARPAPRHVAAPAPVQAASAEPGEVPGEVLFALRPGAGPRALRTILTRERLDLVSSDIFTLVPVTLHRARIRGGRSVGSVVAALARDRQVETAQANHAYSLVGAAPTFASVQYAAAKLRLDEAHRAATGRDVAVAVIDSGVDEAHPALQGAVAERYDALGKAGPPHPHGTAIAGILGARAQLASAAPEARLLAVRAFSGETASGAQGTTLHILRGIDWAARARARVVNMSFAGPRDAALARFLAAGTRGGTVYVAAAGNAGPDAPALYPAADPNVIAVTATDAEDRLFPAANRGAHVCVAAPGVEVLVAAPAGAYGFSSGTSMAAAQVSGIVALMLQARPALSPGEVRSALARGARDLGAPGPDPEFGAGFADAESVLRALPAPEVAAQQASGGMSAPPAPDPGRENP